MKSIQGAAVAAALGLALVGAANQGRTEALPAGLPPGGNVAHPSAGSAAHRPETAAMVLLGSGLLGLAQWVRRSKT